MAALVDAGSSIEAVAARFGVPEQRVKQRLRLGKLPPELLDAYRGGAVSLEIIMAFTLGADHAAQLAVWRQVKEQRFPSAHAVRRVLTESERDVVLQEPTLTSFLQDEPPRMTCSSSFLP